MGGGQWVVDPSLAQQKSAALSLLYAGTRDACTLLEVQVGMPRQAFHHVGICRSPLLGAWSAGMNTFSDGSILDGEVGHGLVTILKASTLLPFSTPAYTGRFIKPGCHLDFSSD